jgi:adenosyl cobinamide kinase/adenosyl cobinamide phosphate guanylyltransferase
MSHHLTLLLGGAQLWQSALACALAAVSGQSITYVATATAADP